MGTKEAQESRHCPEQTEATLAMVQFYIDCGVKPKDIMIIGAYRAEIIELGKLVPKDTLVTDLASFLPPTGIALR